MGSNRIDPANGVLEFHRLNPKKKSRIPNVVNMSTRINGMVFLLSLKMLVRVWQDDQGLVDETILEAGDFTQVKSEKFTV